MSIKINHICKADNENQKLFRQKKINKQQYALRKAMIHTAYIKEINEQEMLNEMMKKYRKGA